jgi:hypothetical protein
MCPYAPTVSSCHILTFGFGAILERADLGDDPNIADHLGRDFFQ